MSSLKVKDLAQKSRGETPAQDRWNVEALYPNEEAWRGEFEEMPDGEELKRFQGKLADPQSALKLLDSYFEFERKLSKLYVYAHLRLDEDLGNDACKSNFGQISSFMHDFRLNTSWIEPEFLSLSESDFQRLLSYPSLSLYHFYFEKLGRMRPHTLAPALEELLALSGKTLETPSRAFGALNNADLTYEDAVDAKGKKYPLTLATLSSYMQNSDRLLRKSAFQNLYQSYAMHTNTICELLQGHVQSHVYLAKARKFDSCLETALYPQQIEPVVYTNLIAAVRKHLPAMYEYLSLRKKLLGLEEMHVYDLAVPLVEEMQVSIDYPAACKFVIDSVAPLGKDYQAILAKGLLEDRWVDVYENARKRSGAYSSGCFDSMPYILMNYNGTLNDVFTLAHEAGHSMHSFFSRKNQPYPYEDYSIFVAEVASKFNEQLLYKHLKAQAKSKKELAYLINHEIDGIRATIFRQTMFAEFEKQIHDWAEEGTPLTPSLLKKCYRQLTADYCGPDLTLDSEIDIEWARIPHFFYYNFYVYQYATGMSAALSLFQQVVDSKKAKERYLEFLSSGGSRYPLDLLERAGVDMRKTAPIDQALNYFAELVAELKKITTEPTSSTEK